MDGPDLDRILEAAGAQFEAAVAAEEDAAASDLALSLLQGSDLAVHLCRSPWVLRRPGGGTAAVRWVGPDAAMASTTASGPPDVIVPLETALFYGSRGEPPTQMIDTFVAILRRRVRTGGSLRIVVGEEPLEGRPKLVTETHVILSRAHGEAVVPLTEIREVLLID